MLFVFKRVLIALNKGKKEEDGCFLPQCDQFLRSAHRKEPIPQLFRAHTLYTLGTCPGLSKGHLNLSEHTPESPGYPLHTLRSKIKNGSENQRFH